MLDKYIDQINLAVRHMVLNRNIMPGIYYSDDNLLQTRIFSYLWVDYFPSRKYTYGLISNVRPGKWEPSEYLRDNPRFRRSNCWEKILNKKF
jgi:hypothetical protein